MHLHLQTSHTLSQNRASHIVGPVVYLTVMKSFSTTIDCFEWPSGISERNSTCAASVINCWVSTFVILHCYVERKHPLCLD